MRIARLLAPSEPGLLAALAGIGWLTNCVV